MAIIITPDKKEKKIIVTFSGSDAVMAKRNGMNWLTNQLLHIVIPRGKQTGA